jgi:hypothetical protein
MFTAISNVKKQNHLKAPTEYTNDYQRRAISSSTNIEPATFMRETLFPGVVQECRWMQVLRQNHLYFYSLAYVRCNQTVSVNHQRSYLWGGGHTWMFIYNQPNEITS